MELDSKSQRACWLSAYCKSHHSTINSAEYTEFVFLLSSSHFLKNGTVFTKPNENFDIFMGFGAAISPS